MPHDREVSPRDYEVTETFPMGGVEVTAVWTVTVFGDETEPTASVAVSAEPRTLHEVRNRDGAVVPLDDVPAGILRRIRDKIEEDDEALKDHLEA